MGMKATGKRLVTVVFLLLLGCGSNGEGGWVYTVQEGDTLQSLAAAQYGDSAKWPAIWLGTNTEALLRPELEVLVEQNSLVVGKKVWIADSQKAAALLVRWTTPGTFISTRCWESIKKYGAADCGYLVAPEQQAVPGNGRRVQIAVAIVRSKAPKPAADPVFLLAGGPGVSGVLTLYSDRILQFLESRDVILIDQRGMGHSQPGLFCQSGETTAACKTRLVKQGIDLTQFHTAAIADDIELLRQVLGCARINLFGFSYGTFLAQELLRSHPEGIRSAVLDSCLPVSVATTTEGGPGAMASFRNLSADCAADTACNGAYPDLENTLYTVLDQASANPFTVTINGTKQSVDSAMLVTSLLMALNSPQQMPYVPGAIKALATGDTGSSALAAVLASNADTRAYLDSQGAKISVQCHDVLAFETYAEAAVRNATLNAHIADHYNLFAKTGHEQCAAWQTGAAAAAFRQPVRSAVPTLILGGRYDTLTCAEWGQTIAATLDNAHFFAVPKTGHVTIQRDCPLSMAKAFLADPSKAPDGACLADIGQNDIFWLP